jgi:SAM-dependent methyltransferase
MHRYVIICVAAVVFAGGCGERAKTGEEMKAGALQAKDEAKAADVAMHPRVAEGAARQAENARTGRGAWSSALDPSTASHRRDIAYVPTRYDTVKDLLWLAEVGPNDVVYDLGSGDGRIVIAAVRDFGARKAVGIEIKPELIEKSRASAAKAGVADKVEFIQGDLFKSDLSEASVVVLYLSHAANLDLRARLISSLKPGSRVVSHQFGMGEWPADKVLDVRTTYFGMYGVMVNQFENNPCVPDFGIIGKGPTHDVISVWTVPAPVAGIWRGKVMLEAGEAEFSMTLHQSLSSVSGTFELTGSMNVSGSVEADLSGDHLRCWYIPSGKGPHSQEMRFDGYASGETLSGSLWVPQGGEKQEVKWAGQRSKADVTGTWEWIGPKGSPVQLKIERLDGQLTLAYTDKNWQSPMNHDGKELITDIYDFGGGFYFTLLLGRESNSVRRVGPDDGWLIGEAVAGDETLNGTISFYPYRSENFGGRTMGPQAQSDANMVPQNGPRDWQAKRKD